MGGRIRRTISLTLTYAHAHRLVLTHRKSLTPYVKAKGDRCVDVSGGRRRKVCFLLHCRLVNVRHTHSLSKHIQSPSVRWPACAPS